MHTIHLNSNDQPLFFGSFCDKFLEICEEHKREKRALAFAFILYDFNNSNISKILQDTEYWLDLNALSGKYLTVFSLHYKPKIRVRPQSTNSSIKLTQFFTISSTFNNPSEDTNYLVTKYFGDIEIKYPSVLFFQVKDDEVIDHILIQLDERHIESSFYELKDYIQEAVDALKNINEDCFENRQEIFDLLKGNVKSHRSLIVTKRKVKKVTSLTELTSSIAGLGV